MEKKTTQRIVGILVVIALVIILMPLLLDKNEAATQTAAVKAPPFPDQQNQASNKVAANDQKDAPSFIDIPPEVADKINKAANETTDQTNGAQPLEATANPVNDVTAQATQPNASATPEAQSNNNAASSSNAMHPSDSAAAQPNAAAPAMTPSNNTAEAQANTGVNTAPATPAQSAPQTTQSSEKTTTQTEQNKTAEPESNHYSVISNSAKPIVDKIVKAVDTKPINTDKSNHLNPNHGKDKHAVKTASAKKLDTHHSMAKLKKVAWAVQLGSFKDKNNARRLADRLRAAGYKAFMHEVKSARNGLQTRVYIGPEYKQASAAKLSTKIEQQMKMHGFIVSYKPLEL